MKAKLILKHRGDYDYFLVSRTDNSETLVASLNPDGEFEQKLSTKNCDEIFGVVDVWSAGLEIELDKLPYTKHLDDGQYNDGQVAGFELGAEWGFNKAMELNKYTEEDIMKAYDFGSNALLGVSKNNLIQSLQQPTEIEVEVEMQCIDPNCDSLDRKGCCIPGDKPRIDAEGYLILKKI